LLLESFRRGCLLTKENK